MTRDGRALRWGFLYRSDALADLSDQDVAYLARLRLHRVVDFRSAAERERDPDRLPDGVSVVWQPIAGQGLDPTELQDRLLAGEVSADQPGRRCSTAPRARTAPDSPPRSC